MYPAELVRPMSEELTRNGFIGLTTPEQVTELLEKNEGTVLLVVNSVCGCAAANARPGARMAAQNAKKPDTLATVFAGVDRRRIAELPFESGFGVFVALHVVFVEVLLHQSVFKLKSLDVGRKFKPPAGLVPDAADTAVVRFYGLYGGF